MTPGGRLLVLAVAALAALGGLLLTLATGWGAPGPGPCSDTVTGALSSCVRPGPPAWALALGALLPAGAVAALAVAWAGRRRHGGR